MKLKITLLVLAACCVFRMNAQIFITENFNNPNNLATDGWLKVNNSSPLGITSWFTGNAAVFPALSSPDSTYIAANYNNTTGNAGTISNWLITPTVTVNDGGVLKFATRTNTAAPQSVAPDRLQVYLSLGTSTSVGTAPTSLGTFSTLILSVNPNLTTTGYPTAWTVYTATLSGITGTTTGRFGFRYFVTSAGPTGTNSSYIGIDNVVYDLPCPNPTLTVSSSTTNLCSGTTLSISASGASTYTWSSGQNTPSITVTPTATTIYTLNASSIPNCNSSKTIAVTVTLTPVLSVPSLTICSGTSATLAVSGAPSYSWSTGSTSATIVDTPTMNTTYTVTGYNGICASSATTQISIGTSLSILPVANPALICSGKATVISAAGAASYSYTSPSFTSAVNGASVSLSPTVNTVYTIAGSTGSCVGTNTILISVNPAPSVSVASSSGSVVCPGSAMSFTVSGAASYSWTTLNSVSSVVTVISSTVPGAYSYAVVGTGTNGCTTSLSVSRTVNACTGVTDSENNVSNLSVFPNPFSAELKVTGLSGNVEIYNALGQMVVKQNVSSSMILGTADLAKGVYILKAYSDDNKLLSTLKLIKN